MNRQTRHPWSRTAQAAVVLLLAVSAAWTLASCGVEEVETPIPQGSPLTATPGKVKVVRAFDAAANEHPEGIAVDKEGNIYVSLARLGQIRKIAPDGSESTLADFGGPKPLGLAVDAEGNVYACQHAPETGAHGIHRISPDGTAERLPGTEQIVHPNGLTLDDERNLYVSDSEAGALWRIPAGGSAELWLQHALLEGTDEAPGYPPIGANGIAFWHDVLYVANSEQATVLRIPILKGGEAGEPEVIIEQTSGLDGICLDLQGRIYGAQGMTSKVIQIDPADGTITELASRSDGLDVPASLAFGTRDNEPESLFVTNYAVSAWSSHPGVVRLELGVPGLPLP